MGNIIINSMEKDKTMLEVLANISHEFKTPINVIYSATQIQELLIKQKDIEKVNLNNKVIRQNCYRLIKLSNNIVDISKVELDILRPEIRIVNIIETVENIITAVASYINEKKMTIIFDTETEEEYVRCDTEFIEKVMLILISNSIKFSKNNGNIVVKIYHSRNGYINISVKDDGIGIPAEDQEAVFDKFYKVDDVFTRRCEGSGIGLALAKSLVELQGGKIILKSKVGQGTEFIINFPITELDEIACTTLEENKIENKSIIEKVNIEFSDIY